MARKGIAKARAMRQDEGRLELREAVVRDSGIREKTKAGVHPVNRLSTFDDSLDRRGRSLDALH
jgi:hypothetical protein